MRFRVCFMESQINPSTCEAVLDPELLQLLSPASLILLHRFTKITREPQAPIGIDWLASRLK